MKMTKKGFTVNETDTGKAANMRSVSASESSSAAGQHASTLAQSPNYNRIRLPLVVALVVAGGAILLLSYLSEAIVLVFIGLGLILWGVLLLYITNTRYVHEELLGASSVSLIKSLDTLVSNYGYAGKSIFIHPKTLKGMDRGYVFIPAQDEENVPRNEYLADEKLIQENPKGILFPAPSQSLVNLFESKLGTNISTVDIAYLQEKLPVLLIDILRVANEVILDKTPDNRNFTLRVRGGPWIDVCRQVSQDTRIGSHLGCPICGACALALSKSLAIPVKIKQTVTTQNTIETVYQSVN